MGFEYLKAAVKCERVEGTTKLVLIVLADRANNRTGVCWPSVRKVAKDAGIAKSTAQAHLKAIEALGIMEVIERGDQMRSNRYRLDLDAMTASDCVQPDGVPTTGTGDVPDAGTPVPNGLHESVPEAGTEPISFEPVKKPVTSNQSVREEATKQQIPLTSRAECVSSQKKTEQESDRTEDGIEGQDMDERYLRIWGDRHAGALASIWQAHTGNGLASDEIDLAKALIAEHGLDEVGAELIDTFSCPPLRKIAWRDFRVWARNYPLNKAKVLAWRRSLGQEKAGVVAEETKTALASHLEAAEEECFDRLGVVEVPDDFRCADCEYDKVGQRTRWCRDCYDEMRGEGDSACELGISLGDCPECRGMTPDGWEYCERHGCAHCGTKPLPGCAICETCLNQI